MRLSFDLAWIIDLSCWVLIRASARASRLHIIKLRTRLAHRHTGLLTKASPNWRRLLITFTFASHFRSKYHVCSLNSKYSKLSFKGLLVFPSNAEVQKPAIQQRLLRKLPWDKKSSHLRPPWISSFAIQLSFEALKPGWSQHPDRSWCNQDILLAWTGMMLFFGMSWDVWV